MARKFLILVVASFSIVAGGVFAVEPTMEPKISPQSDACRLVFQSAGANKSSQREPICIRNISADSCEELASSKSGVAGALSDNFNAQVATSCDANDCVLDVVYPSDAAHCQGITLTPTRVKVDKTTTSVPVSASF